MIDKVLARDDIYETTSPLELRRFLTMLEARPRFTPIYDLITLSCYNYCSFLICKELAVFFVYILTTLQTKLLVYYQF